MKLKSLSKSLLYWAGAIAGIYTLCILVGSIARPDVTGLSEKKYTPEEIQAAREARDTTPDLKNAPVLHVDVDYSQGPKAQWYPKGESPILAGLVKAGKLPPVAQRVGPEPCVMKGCDGIGRYGGTWMRVGNTPSDAAYVMHHRMSYQCLLRWSPMGWPIKPHLARSLEISKDNCEFTFTLRKGVKWSDGHPFTADDIMYWWKYECCDKSVMPWPHNIMKVNGKPGRIEKLGLYRVKFIFPEPNGLFVARMATSIARRLVDCPAHYLKQYHPRVGDKKLIAKHMAERNIASPLSLYMDIKDPTNPEHPHLWPWVCRTQKANAPFTFVRNPYYWVVDTQGNQLPYVDRVMFDVKSSAMIGLSAASGEITFQHRHIRYDDYTLLMSQREKYGYDVYHYYPSERSTHVICPNLNLYIDPDKPETRLKHELLNDKRFRQALSLAIDRKTIIDALSGGQATASQVAPGPASLFYEPSLNNSYIEYDPKRANELLDEIGLTGRDREGCRTFKDGSRMTFMFNYCPFMGQGPTQFVVDDWAKVGVRVILRERSRVLYAKEGIARLHDINMWTGSGEYYPVIAPIYFLPVPGCYYAWGFTRWYQRGGHVGNPHATREHGCIEPPKDHPMREAMKIYARACRETDPTKQAEIFRGVLKIAARNTWTINVGTPPPRICVVKRGFKNVPRRGVACWDFMSPGNFGPETFYFENPKDSPGAIRQMTREIITPTLLGKRAAADNGKPDSIVGTILCWGFLALAILIVVLVALKHPYVGRRLLIMVPTLLVISIIVFTVIQLPPGDFITTYIMRLRESGEQSDFAKIEEIKEMFHLDEPQHRRYFRWMGLKWFTTFEPADTGLLQGNLGRSMETQKPVNDIVGDRITLTILISLGTILFTWAMAIPIGIYSAVKQYSIADYVLTFIGFLGMCVPGFLLALLLMYISSEWLGIPISGLFSSQYGAQPEWTWGKVVDLLKHIWVPVVVLGVGGTAGMIRVMRANLLDELKKPYVTTARAKGVRPMKLLFKYPVRLALNPFVSGIGGLFPQLVSGGAIVALVLGLPTVGPLMLSALMNEDMYLAGSMLMVLSLLGVIGTLVSDLLLLWLDPRIRFKGGSR